MSFLPTTLSASDLAISSIGGRVFYVGQYVRFKMTALRSDVGKVTSIDNTSVHIQTHDGFDVTKPHSLCTPAMLVICDLNGVLGFRKGRGIARRPFVEELLAYLFKNFAVGVWTSGIQKNADPFIDDVFGHLQDRLVCREYREKCTPHPTVENPHGTIKDLRKVWADLRDRGLNFDEQNTIMIDDSEYKCSHRHNALCPTPYAGEEGNDQGLHEIKDELKKVLEARSLTPLRKQIEINIGRCIASSLSGEDNVTQLSASASANVSTSSISSCSVPSGHKVRLIRFQSAELPNPHLDITAAFSRVLVAAGYPS